MENRGPWLGQVPLILGPSSWGSGGIPFSQYRPTPPFYGEWGVIDQETGKSKGGGRVGPFNTTEEAAKAASTAARAAGARMMPLDGYIQVVDSHGQVAGVIT